MTKFLNNRIYLFSIALLVFLGSCRLGKEYQRPELDLPKEFNSVSYADTSSIADIEWRKFFTDTSLIRLIEKGITYNHDLLIAVKRMDISGVELRQSKSLMWPEVDLRLTGQVNRPSDNSLSGISLKSFLGKSYVENYSASVNVSWEADIWGKIRGQKEIALAQYLQSAEGVKAVQTQLVSDISAGYFNLLMLDKQLTIARRNLVLRDSFLVATRLLKDAGLTNALAVEQAESQRLQTVIIISQLEQNLGVQENALHELTGEYPSSVRRKITLNGERLQHDLKTGIPVAMVSRRPDIRATELALMSANARVGVAQASMYPALNITVGAGLEAFRASNWFNIPGSLFGIAAGTIAQPIFKRNQLKAQFEIAKLEREEAVIRFRQSVLQAVTEVSDAMINVEKLQQQYDITKQQVDTLQRAVINAHLLFRSDMANYLEVITAQAAALQAELNLATVERQQLEAVIDLYRSLGGGWK